MVGWVGKWFILIFVFLGGRKCRQKGCRCGALLRRCCHPAPQEREGVETDKPWRRRSKRGPARLEVSGSCHLATVERIPPPESHRGQDELHQAARPIHDGPRLRLPGRRTARAYRRAKRLHRPRRTRHRARRIGPSGERGATLRPRFMQQRPAGAKPGATPLFGGASHSRHRYTQQRALHRAPDLEPAPLHQRP